MIVLGKIEFARRRDLGGDGAQSLGRQRLLVGRLRHIGGFALRVAEGIDRGAILGADVVALTHALGRIVTFPERLEQLVVGGLVGIEHHQHHFGMAGAARANLLVSGVGGVAASVAYRSGEDAIAELPEFTLRAPEAAEPEHRLLQALRVGWLQRMTVDEMAPGRGHRLGTARQRIGGARQCSGFAHEQHGLPPDGMASNSKQNSIICLYAGQPRYADGSTQSWQRRRTFNSANSRSAACGAGTPASARYPISP